MPLYAQQIVPIIERETLTTLNVERGKKKCNNILWLF